MKNHTVCLFIAFLLTTSTAFSQEDQSLKAGYYVVVGAFGSESNAQRFVETLIADGNDAEYGLDPIRNLNYVYVLYSPSFKTALAAMREYRRTGTFDEAWVKTMTGDLPTRVRPYYIEELEAEEALQTEEIAEDNSIVVEDEPEKEKEGIRPLGILVFPLPEKEQAEEALEAVPDKVEVAKPNTLASIQVFMNLFNPTNNRIVDGEVQVVDTERAKLISKVEGNKLLYLPNPNTHTGAMSLITDVFGYRKVQHEVNYFEPVASAEDNSIEYTDGTLIINFNLVRYRKGDITVLYNVYFYDDAALMRPESKYELNTLLQMMEENPDYRIMLHGHTNAKYYGQILSLGPAKNFFEITADAVETSGSAKNLARKRAETIKEYLVYNGIAEDRVEIKSWGGKNPIVNPLGPDARQNVRVEVEILSD